MMRVRKEVAMALQVFTVSTFEQVSAALKKIDYKYVTVSAESVK